MNKNKKGSFNKTITIMTILLAVLMISLTLNWIALLLYSWILVETFGWPALTFWKMYGLTFLIGLVAGLFEK